MLSLIIPTLSTPAPLSKSESKPSEIYAEKKQQNPTTTVQWTSGTLTLLDHGSAKVQLYS